MGLLDKLQSMLGSDRVNIDRRFELLKQAVSGTMSKFYMARDRTTGKLVGLKVGDKEKVTLFEARFKGLKKPPEGKIAMSIHHPLVVETFEYGMTTTDVPYLVMEYVEGAGMHTLVHNRAQILDGRRLNLIRQMAESINAVHKAGYIHRDICPRNFICSADAEKLKLIDFGLTLPATKEFMQPGNRTGTPLYMSPEVVRRKATDQRVDIFSFGATAYHLCAFEMPWPVGDMTGADALSHDTIAAKPLSEYCPRLHKDFAATIMKCISPRASDRPQSMEQVLKMLREIPGDET